MTEELKNEKYKEIETIIKFIEAQLEILEKALDGQDDILTKTYQAVDAIKYDIGELKSRIK